MSALKQYGGLALMAIGAVLLVVCRIVGWQSNAELLAGWLMIVLGYIVYLWLQKHGEKY